MPSSSSPEPEDHRSGRVKRRGRRASKSGGEGVSDLIDQSSDYGDEDLGFNVCMDGCCLVAPVYHRPRANQSSSAVVSNRVVVFSTPRIFLPDGQT